MSWLAEDRGRLDAFRSGDRQTLAEVYRHYSPQLSRKLAVGFNVQMVQGQFRFVGLSSAYELADIVQETFIRAFSPKARSAYDGLRPFSAYLMTISRNLVIDLLRRGGKESKLFVPLEKEGLHDAHAVYRGESPEEAAVKSQLQKVYLGFFATLTEQEQAVFQGRFVQEISRPELSRQLGLTIMQIRIREDKMRERLLTQLLARDGDRSSWAVLLLLTLVD